MWPWKGFEGMATPSPLELELNRLCDQTATHGQAERARGSASPVLELSPQNFSREYIRIPVR